MSVEMSFLPENLNLFLFHPISFCKQHPNTHTHTHTKDIFLPSFSFCLPFVNKRHTHARTKELSGDVLISFFLWYSPLLSALTFILCLFVCFCFVLSIFMFCESYVAPALPLQRQTRGFRQGASLGFRQNGLTGLSWNRRIDQHDQESKRAM